MKLNLPLIAYKIRSALLNRFRYGVIESEEALSEFLASRSAYVAQTSLFGYLKTRMGTQFPRYFEDELFSPLIHDSAVKLFVSCLSDLTVYGVALVVRDTDISVQHAERLATRLYEAALQKGVEKTDRSMLPGDAAPAFRERARTTVWESACQGEFAFSKSPGDLVRYAPVTDEFKELDREIVRNSIRFRWRDVRDQLKKRLHAEAFGDVRGD